MSFLASLSRAEAELFFEQVAEGVQQGDRVLQAAFDDSKLAGTVQILTAMPPNQPHRANVAKLLVRRSARRPWHRPTAHGIRGRSQPPGGQHPEMRTLSRWLLVRHHDIVEAVVNQTGDALSRAARGEYHDVPAWLAHSDFAHSVECSSFL